MAERADDLAPRLGEAVAAHVKGAAGIKDLKRLSGGASQETWAFDAVDDKGALVERLILRRAPGGTRPESATAVPLETEAKLIHLAEEVGVPVPPVRYVLTEADGLGQGFVMGRVEGETIARKILRDEEFAPARPIMARQCGEILAKLHSVQMDKLPDLRVSDSHTEIEQYFEAYKAHGHPHPVLELAFRWLRDNAPETPKRTLVHGDFRHGNLMIGPDGVRAVLDWEISHIGDPMEDMGWICVNSWRFGGIDNPVGGFGKREDMFEGYEAAGGGKVDPARVHFWETLGTLKWGVMCMGMISAFRTTDPSVERATIGRRTSETEIDLLRLLAPVV